MGISPTHAATSSMNPRPTMELAFESSVPIVTSSIVSGDVDLIRGFTDAEIMGFVEELEMLAASHSTVSHIPSLRPQAVSAPSECKLERQDSAVSAASGRWADLLPPSRSDATPLIESIFAMPTMPTTKSLPAGSSLPPSRSQSIGSNGQHSFSFASSHTAGSQPSSPSNQKRKRAHPEIGDNFLHLILVRSSFPVCLVPDTRCPVGPLNVLPSLPLFIIRCLQFLGADQKTNFRAKCSRKRAPRPPRRF